MMTSNARFSIGIDLGTTHCALAWVDLQLSDTDKTVHGVLPIPQCDSPGVVQAHNLLPSFLYLPHEAEFGAHDLNLPWHSSTQASTVVGELARNRGSATPIRLVSSAKSWLSHSGMDRRAGILPADAPAEVTRVSPVQASAHYLQHLRSAWDAAYPAHAFTEQDITITIPASFDPAARELTLEAAQLAGYPNLTLLEEPQAALYHWIAASHGEWRKQVKPNEVILVIDVGGGTTDFSLIAVLEKDGQLELHRIAVGDHILLGGDNMDLTLAHVVAAKLAKQDTKLDAWQMRALAYACRQAKESLLTQSEIDSVPLVIASRGSKLIGGSIRTELTRAEVTQIILEGFFPKVEASAQPQQRPRSGLSQVGLPYAQDAGITRHLAALLSRQVHATKELTGFADHSYANFLHPSAVLFNGGVFKSALLEQRCLDTINTWLDADQELPARSLTGSNVDLAVAQGAAYYGFVRRGQGIRIRGGTAKSYYIGLESSMPAIPGFEPPLQALCVAPFGMEEGSTVELLEQEFALVVGEPVFFRFFGSSVRRQDAMGYLLDDSSELDELNEIQGSLASNGRTAGELVQVKLQAHVSSSGTLELRFVAVNGGEVWKIEFNVREQAGH
jgi:molecular chaperone DnaK (HSP70)